MTQHLSTKPDVTKHYDTTFIQKKPDVRLNIMTDVTKHYDTIFD